VKARVIASLSVLALTAALAPLTGLAATGTTQSYDLTTRQYDISSAGEYDGRMRIRVAPDGIVGGTFTDTEGQISQVVGGLDGTKIWLQIGDHPAARKLTFNGAFVDGKLKATAPRGLHLWTLEGTPAKH
jgi:hypothetical protein